MKPTYRKSWAGNLLMWSDLALDPSFKVKQCLVSTEELTTDLKESTRIYFHCPSSLAKLA